MYFEINNQTKVKIKNSLIPCVIRQTERLLKVKKDKKISIALVSKKEIRKLNKMYRGLDKVTSVLSFTAAEKKFIGPKNEKSFLGEIILAPEIIRQQAIKQKKSFNQQFVFIFLHGLLHLLGFGHQTEREAKKMRNWENKIINQLG